MPNKHKGLSAQVRNLFVQRVKTDLERIAADLGTQLSALLDEACDAREMQKRRDAWVAYPNAQSRWVQRSLRIWVEMAKSALQQQAALAKGQSLNTSAGTGSGLTLIEEDTVEEKILASRMALRLLDKVSWELNDLTVRMKSLERIEELSKKDVLRPESLCQSLIEAWIEVGMAREAWDLVQKPLQEGLLESLPSVYKACNDLLISHGVMEEIDLRHMLKRTPGGSTGAGSTATGTMPMDAGDEAAQQAADQGGYYGGGGGAYPSGGRPQQGGGQYAGGLQQNGGAYQHGGGDGSGAADRIYPDMSEMVMLDPSAPPIVPHAPSRRHFGFSLDKIRHHAEQVYGGIKRVLNQKVGLPALSVPAVPTPQLMQALMPVSSGDEAAPAPAPAQQHLLQAVPYEEVPDGGYMPVHIQRAQEVLREHSNKLKDMTDEAAEKAIIELVALIFQNILHEERIASGIRIWIARLQMPVLRLALAEPVFFESLDHPARKLIDHLGACVLGFSGDPPTEALEREIKRMVQVIEQYPETGKRVFEIVYEEFRKFLADYLPNQSDDVTRMVSLASQVEEKEAMVVQYTIELRDRIQHLSLRDAVRDFLYQVWPEVLAVSSVKFGPQSDETHRYKKLPPQLIWASAAKPNRAERQRAIAEVPGMLDVMREGMALIAMNAEEQKQQVAAINAVLTDAFMSKTDPIDQEALSLLTERLAAVEDYVYDGDMGDFELTADNLEMVLGFDVSGMHIISGAEHDTPDPALRQWMQTLLLGSWHRLDHNGHMERVQFCWRSNLGQLYLFVSADGNTYLFQCSSLAAYLKAALLLPAEEEALTVLATREALAKIQANPERLAA